MLFSFKRLYSSEGQAHGFKNRIFVFWLHEKKKFQRKFLLITCLNKNHQPTPIIGHKHPLENREVGKTDEKSRHNLNHKHHGILVVLLLLYQHSQVEIFEPKKASKRTNPKESISSLIDNTLSQPRWSYNNVKFWKLGEPWSPIRVKNQNRALWCKEFFGHPFVWKRRCWQKNLRKAIDTLGKRP